MPESSTLAVFMAATLALLLVPGPAVLYIIARGIDELRQKRQEEQGDLRIQNLDDDPLPKQLAKGARTAVDRRGGVRAGQQGADAEVHEISRAEIFH